ncbi:hypothetical protein AYI70_g5551 [Smittium culicis]|uniref:Uncharacterized protein n=1 Tax=Smittium culicis TaxID=133412 RepID=A0A1R1XU07_9FUNG|nr:hypothetical protein AYI70_g5551 [Smittium culicis]
MAKDIFDHPLTSMVTKYEKINAFNMVVTTQTAAIEDQPLTVKTSKTEFTVYPKLTEVIPSIEEDFIRSLIADKENKEAIHSCPKSSIMEYSPSWLKDTTSSVEKKAEKAFNGVQVVLAQASLLEDYDGQKNIQKNPRISVHDPRIVNYKKMRLLLSEIT